MGLVVEADLAYTLEQRPGVNVTAERLNRELSLGKLL